MSLLDKLLGRKVAEPDAAPDDSWMTDEQRNAKLAWWESKWMDRIVNLVRLVFTAIALTGTLGLLGLLGWTLWSTPVPALEGPISIDMTRAASFGMLPIVLGVPIGLVVLYFVGFFLFRVIVAIFKSPVHKVFKPMIAPIVSTALLVLVGFFHQPIHGLAQGLYFKVVQTHRLAKTPLADLKAPPPATTPSTAP